MENLTAAFQRERQRSIRYDNIHAGAIVEIQSRKRRTSVGGTDVSIRIRFICFYVIIGRSDML
jgi:hypothetical protein